MKILNQKSGAITYAPSNLTIEEIEKDSLAKGLWIEISPASFTNLTITFATGLTFDGEEIYWGDGAVTKLPQTNVISHTYKVSEHVTLPKYWLFIKNCTSFISSNETTSGPKIFTENNQLVSRIVLGYGITVSPYIFSNLNGLKELRNIQDGEVHLVEAAPASLSKISFHPSVSIIGNDYCPGSSATPLKMLDICNSLQNVKYIGQNAFRYWIGDSTKLLILNLPYIRYIGQNALLNMNNLKTIVLGYKELTLEITPFSLISSDFKCLYKGTPTEWATLVTGNGKTSELTEKTYYYFEEYPGEGIKAWHYVKGVPTIW